ncbi:hypothetical protein BG015_010572 [Linnemannia schmuckeri]|uniref:Protein kinase domain-containing protein n=1 Tax=Linnemannia schmuckeri TaxID=64567 RepID=A0A9P5RTU7_9FUNG|nr:hypothetical protein BG015_010572 [Linnemannia schmuckeri]
MERSILLDNEHENNVSFINAFQQEGENLLVIELCPFEILEEFMRRRGCLHENDVRRLGHQLIEGVIHLHDMGFLHRDLRPENALFSEVMVPTVADLASLSIVATAAEGSGICGTYWFIPAKLARKGRYSTKLVYKGDIFTVMYLKLSY